ncbi:MAG TPA: hypothetical protein VGQ72_03535 [Pyrinomonadaceae bacterium]|nr:hypothetical protein [Pyrinomonadaceae bacterium]
MESGWEEKKLKALFSELKATDEQTSPRFAGVWNRAQIAPRRIRAFSPAFVAATALLVFGLVFLAVWSRYSQRTSQQPMVVSVPTAPLPTSTTAPSPSNEINVKPVTPRNILAVSRANKLAARRHAMLVAANRKLTKDAKTIANWQSPTTALLTSPSDEIFSSLPQFNQSTTQLKSFLPTRSN